MHAFRVAAIAVAATMAVAGVAASADAHPVGKHRHAKKAKRAKRGLVRAALARSDNRSKPIVFVHGLDAFGTAGADCNQWNAMKSALQGWGWTGTMATLRYYEGDANCSYSSDHHGSHSVHYASGHSAGSHTANADIRHLGYHFAWTVYDHFSSAGQAVDVVGHSMGGLIARYAIDQVQRGSADFPPYLHIEDVVTFGTPHTGSGWASGCWWSTQCNQMVPGSSFMSYLASSAPNPQASGGTDWTNTGSDDDGIVSWDSAVGMDATHKVVYLTSMNIGHSDYYTDTSAASDADVNYWDRPGPWYAWYDAPHAVRWADYAMYLGTW